MADAGRNILDQCIPEDGSSIDPTEEFTARSEYRLRHAARRLIGVSVLISGFTVAFWFALFRSLGPVIDPYKPRIACLLLLLILAPQFTVTLINWKNARRGIAQLGEIGEMTHSELQHVLVRRQAMGSELKDSRSYIDVMHDQI